MARILVLDNDRAMRGLLALAVERGGHEVLQAGTVDEAESAMQATDPVDGMLLDLHLGGGHSGVSVVERWRAADRLAPFLVVTGTPEDPSLARLDGEPRFHGVLAKPFLLDELLQRVEDLTAKQPEPEQEPEQAVTPWIEAMRFGPFRPDLHESIQPLVAPETPAVEEPAELEAERES